MEIFSSKPRQTTLLELWPWSGGRRSSFTTLLTRFFSSLALSLSQNFNRQGALSLYDCLHLPPFQFLFKLFGLRFWFDWLWANTPLDWICRCPSLFCYDNVSYNSRSNDGVCHADELFMLFKAHQVPITMVRNETDKRVRNPRSKSRQFNSFR